MAKKSLLNITSKPKNSRFAHHSTSACLHFVHLCALNDAFSTLLQWDDEEKRWIRSFPPGPPVKSKQFEAKKKETVPVRSNQRYFHRFQSIYLLLSRLFNRYCVFAIRNRCKLAYSPESPRA